MRSMTTMMMMPSTKSTATTPQRAQPRRWSQRQPRSAPGWCASARGGRRAVCASAMSCSMQFIRGVEEPTVPEVKLTRSRDGGQGTATLYFEKPAVFENTGEAGEITGLYMIDDEGEMSTVDVVAKFKNGQPAGIEAKYVMKSTTQWDRFMRFMQRYAADNNLGFNKS